MKIETKFDIGQEVFFMFNNKVRKDEIDRIRVHVNYKGFLCTKKETVVLYGLTSWDGDNDYYDERQLFASKEELLASL